MLNKIYKYSLIFVLTFIFCVGFSPQILAQLPFFPRVNSVETVLPETPAWDLNKARACGRALCSDVFFYGNRTIRLRNNLFSPLRRDIITIASPRTIERSLQDVAFEVEQRARSVQNVFLQIFETMRESEQIGNLPQKDLTFWLSLTKTKPLHPLTPVVDIGYENNQTVIFIAAQPELGLTQQTLITVTGVDARANNQTLEELSQKWRRVVIKALSEALWGLEMDRQQPFLRLQISLLTIFITLILIIIAKFFGSLTHKWNRNLHRQLKEIQNSLLVDPEAKPVKRPFTDESKIDNKNLLIKQNYIPVSGIQFGKIFVGVQPSRGYDLDPSLNYHAPDLEPTHNYLAFYYWLKNVFQADVIIHVGKHGNLEWLPGKSLVLSENCYPEIALGTLPHFYPFIVNDPGEGTQAKRRANAVILDHLTPPLTRAELYGELLELEALIDEYYQAQSLNPSRLKIICDRISNLIKETKLNEDLGIKEVNKDSLTEFLTIADGYLCELKEAQIRDGLHIFGQCPEGRQLRDLIGAIARFSSYNNLGLIESIKEDLKHNKIPPLLRGVRGDKNYDLLRQVKGDKNYDLLREVSGDQNHDNIEDQDYLENIANELIERIIKGEKTAEIKLGKHTEKSLNWIENKLLPNLRKTEQEITNLMRGLEGKYIPSGSSGAPTRGRSDVLPTGRNFYSVDIRAIPSETAWDVGRKAAETVIERYTQENGEYPRTLAISVWGTSTMRTGGDDIAQIMALMGVKPVWDGVSRRVVDFEVIPIEVLGRPRVDVTVRVSGFFRDGFPIVMELFYKINQHLSTLIEEKENNPLAQQVEKDTQYWIKQGLEEKQARERATYRLFGSKPGAYGAGLQGLIEAQNWQTDEDLARAYLNWSSYAYTGTKGVSQPEAFEQRLKELQIVLHNQDNREHDLLDSDDYYQFQGGLTAAVRHLQGQNPTVYFGDNSQPDNPKVRHLQEEIARVYRSRVINPKWIAGVMRHGYKGAFEMSATVDYLFAYSATTKTVPDFMFTGVAESYLLDDKVRQFIQEKNPWALRDMGERLIEAHQRKLWQNVDQDLLDQLRHIIHESEAVIEECRI